MEAPSANASLSPSDCIRLESTLATLLSPQTYARLDDWRSAVNASLKALLDADAAYFCLPQSEGAVALYSEDLPPEELAACSEEYAYWSDTTHREQGVILRAAEECLALFRSLDAAAEGFLLCDLDGQALHRNTALCALLEGDPEREQLLRHLEKAARDLAVLAHPRRTSEEGTPAERAAAAPAAFRIRTQNGAYEVSACYVGEQIDARHYVLVTLKPQEETLPSGAVLRKRFGLTQRQAEVALLLAERRRNREIAEMLFISPHTARHHTEQVLAKLGVGSRTEVRVMILAKGDRHR